MVCCPDHILTFGKHKSFRLAQVYQYDPTYLDFIIEYTSIILDLKSFAELPVPTPYRKHIKVQGVEFWMLPDSSRWQSIIPEALEEERKGKVFEESSFVFSEKMIAINQQKIDGTYIVPEYKFSEVTIEVRNMLNNR